LHKKQISSIYYKRPYYFGAYGFEPSQYDKPRRAIIVSTETLPDKVLGKPSQYLVSTDIALANIGYPKEVWIVPKNLMTLVVRGSVKVLHWIMVLKNMN